MHTVESEVGSWEEHVLGVAGDHEQPVPLRVDLVVREQPLGRHAEHTCSIHAHKRQIHHFGLKITSKNAQWSVRHPISNKL